MNIEASIEEYKSIIFSGGAVDQDGVSICNLKNHVARIGANGANEYQVWCDRQNYHAIFKNIDEAVKKFVELIQLRRMGNG